MSTTKSNGVKGNDRGQAGEEVPSVRRRDGEERLPGISILHPAYQRRSMRGVYGIFPESTWNAKVVPMPEVRPRGECVIDDNPEMSWWTWATTMPALEKGPSDMLGMHPIQRTEILQSG